jgi:hypothetical protein
LTTRGGRRVTKDTPGAVKVDLGASRVLETDAALARHGRADPERQEHGKRPLTAHLEDYRRSLLAKDDCPSRAECVFDCLISSP